MRKLSPRAVRGSIAVAAAGAVAAAVLLPSTSTSALAVSNVNSSAYGVSASLLSGTVTIPPTGQSTCPPGGTVLGIAVGLGALGGVGVSTGTTACNSGAGTSSASGSVANVAVLTPAPLVASLVTATCSADATSPPTGSSTLVNASLLGVPIVVSPAKNTQLVNTAILKITLNEQIPATPTTGGTLTVNAIHIQILLGQTVVADIILGSATCGPNTPVVVGDAFSFQNLPLILGGLALIVMIGFGLRMGTRRLRGQA